MAEKKPSSREQVKQIVAQIENGIQELCQPVLSEIFDNPFVSSPRLTVYQT